MKILRGILSLAGIPEFVDNFLSDTVPDTAKYVIFYGAAFAALCLVILVCVWIAIAVQKRKNRRNADKGYSSQIEGAAGAAQASAALRQETLRYGEVAPMSFSEPAPAATPGSLISYSYGEEYPRAQEAPAENFSATLQGLRTMIFNVKFMERDLNLVVAELNDQNKSLLELQSTIAALDGKLTAATNPVEIVEYNEKLRQTRESEQKILSAIELGNKKYNELNETLAAAVEETKTYILNNDISKEDIILVEESVRRELAAMRPAKEDAVRADSGDSFESARNRFAYLSAVAANIINNTGDSADAVLKLKLLRAEAERADLYAKVAQQAAKAAIYEAQNAPADKKEALEEAARDAINKANEARKIAQIILSYAERAQASIDGRNLAARKRAFIDDSL